MKMVLIAAMALAPTARALFRRAPHLPVKPGGVRRAASRPTTRQFAHPPRPARDLRSAEAPKGAEVTLDAQQATGSAGGGAAAAQQGAPQQQHHRALEQLEAVERALHAHLSVPGTPFRLGVDTALGRVAFAGAAACGAHGKTYASCRRGSERACVCTGLLALPRLYAAALLWRAQHLVARAHWCHTLRPRCSGVFAYAAVGAYTLATACRYQAGPLLLTRMAGNVRAPPARVS